MRVSLWTVLLAAGCAAVPESPHPGLLPKGEKEISIPIDLQRPPGVGPFPAVVLLHDCSGLGPNGGASPRRWAKLLVEEGYVVVVPDSFSTRGFPDGVCTDPRPGRLDVAPGRRVADALEALRYARSMPFVDGKRVAVMGGSHGGASTLATLASSNPEARTFAAGVSLYPNCGVRLGDWRPGQVYRPNAPLVILAGELDDWTPAEPCRRLVEASRAAGHPVHIKVYPGAHHAFDSPAPVRFNAQRINGNAPGGRGATTGGNPEAWADSIKEVKAFLAKYLRG